MYPNEIFFGIDLYQILISVGLIACYILMGFLADLRRIKRKLQNFALVIGTVSIVCGFGTAILFQAFYNMGKTGTFKLASDTGATFYGGLVGGAVVFLLIYFIAGKFYFGGETAGYHKQHFFEMAGCIVPCITLAHGFGRLGCLMAGCCHGARTDAWYALPMWGDQGYGTYVPIQLFEAVFLFALTAILILLILKKKNCGLAIYASSYAAWRFIIEFFRADDRGALPFGVLTPSQFVALILFFVGLLLLINQDLIESKLLCVKKRKDVRDEEKDQ